MTTEPKKAFSTVATLARRLGTAHISTAICSKVGAIRVAQARTAETGRGGPREVGLARLAPVVQEGAPSIPFSSCTKP